ncbi:FKBP12-associated protein [Blyttiomyces sp. JEL0837]|nr:FKBP12-associated protein [Blyttiomyces sp. JEL0837]
MVQDADSANLNPRAKPFVPGDASGINVNNVNVTYNGPSRSQNDSSQNRNQDMSAGPSRTPQIAGNRSNSRRGGGGSAHANQNVPNADANPPRRNQGREDGRQSSNTTNAASSSGNNALNWQQELLLQNSSGNASLGASSFPSGTETVNRPKPSNPPRSGNATTNDPTTAGSGKRRQRRKPRGERSGSQRNQVAPTVTAAENEDLMAALTQGLSNETYECMICYDTVKARDRIWSCTESCFAVFHHKCIRQWSLRSQKEPAPSSSSQPPREFSNWRCPGCNCSYNEEPPTSCFCGKVEDVALNRYLVPHSCRVLIAVEGVATLDPALLVKRYYRSRVGAGRAILSCLVIKRPGMKSEIVCPCSVIVFAKFSETVNAMLAGKNVVHKLRMTVILYVVKLSSVGAITAPINAVTPVVVTIVTKVLVLMSCLALVDVLCYIRRFRAGLPCPSALTLVRFLNHVDMYRIQCTIAMTHQNHALRVLFSWTDNGFVILDLASTKQQNVRLVVDISVRCVVTCKSPKTVFTGYCSEDKPCKCPIVQKCPCGNRTNETSCGAWKESLGKKAGVTLECDDNCLLLERNRRLAEALDISTPSATPTEIVYDDFLLRYANQNLTWVKGVEKTLAEFVKDPVRRMVHFPHTKAKPTRFIEALVSHYHLVPEIVDAERGKGSVIARKTISKTPSVPSVLVSVAAARYKPTATIAPVVVLPQPRASNAPAQGSSSAWSSDSKRLPVNGIKVASLLDSIDERDLKIMIEPILGGITVKWLEQDDFHSACIQIASSRRMPIEEIEQLLLSKRDAVHSKLVQNNWAQDVSCCWIAADGTVTEKAEDMITPKSSSIARIVEKAPPTEENQNRFGALSRMEGGKIDEISLLGNEPTPEDWETA